MTEDPIRKLRGWLVEETAKCQALEAKLGALRDFARAATCGCATVRKVAQLEVGEPVSGAYKLDDERRALEQVAVRVVPLADVERVMRPVLEAGRVLGKYVNQGLFDAARAWLDEAKR